MLSESSYSRFSAGGGGTCSVLCARWSRTSEGPWLDRDARIRAGGASTYPLATIRVIGISSVVVCCVSFTRRARWTQSRFVFPSLRVSHFPPYPFKRSRLASTRLDGILISGVYTSGGGASTFHSRKFHPSHHPPRFVP